MRKNRRKVLTLYIIDSACVHVCASILVTPTVHIVAIMHYPAIYPNELLSILILLDLTAALTKSVFISC